VKKYTEKEKNSYIEKVLELMAEHGMSRIAACRQAGVTRSTLISWIGESDELADRFRRARQLSLEYQEEDMLDMVDAKPERSPVTGVIDPAYVNLIKMRVDYRKWRMAVENQGKYGTKVEHRGSEDAPMVIKQIERVFVDTKKE
jgi:transposase